MDSPAATQQPRPISDGGIGFACVEIVIPKPPFARDVSLEEERAAFEGLKQQLRVFWSQVFPRDDQPYTSVVVPSVTPEEQGPSGNSFLEERLLFLLIRLRNPRARLVYVTSQPIHPLVIDYYLQLLFGIPGSHARSRLVLLCAHDRSARSLTQKILDRPRLLERIRAGIDDKARAYLSVFETTPLERRLAVLLGIPLNGLDPELAGLERASMARQVFDEAGVRSASDGDTPKASRETPSVEIRINPQAAVSLSSTHERLRFPPGGAPALLFPANEADRAELQTAALRIGHVLATRGVASRCSVEFEAEGRSPERRLLRARSLRFGMGATTHPMLALRFLTGGRLDPVSGLFFSPRGEQKFYVSTDDLESDAYQGLLPEDVIEILTINHLSFNQRSETGVLFHMIDGVSEFGRVGTVAIGNTPAEAQALFERTIRILDHETRFGR